MEEAEGTRGWFNLMASPSRDNLAKGLERYMVERRGQAHEALA